MCHDVSLGDNVSTFIDLVDFDIIIFHWIDYEVFKCYILWCFIEKLWSGKTNLGEYCSCTTHLLIMLAHGSMRMEYILYSLLLQISQAMGNMCCVTILFVINV